LTADVKAVTELLSQAEVQMNALKERAARLTAAL
jgi:hypothetical protein